MVELRGVKGPDIPFGSGFERVLSGGNIKLFNRRGWFLSEEALKKELLAQMGKGFGAHHGGAERQESAEQHAQALIRQELERVGWDEAELKRQPKSARRKVRIARRLRAAG